MANLFKKLVGLDDKKNNDKNLGEAPNNKLLKRGGNARLDEEWLDNNYEEGQLSVDVYQTSNNLIVTSTIAGVKPENIDVSLNNDMLTIRGKRETKQTIKDDDYLYRECYWGNFSRSIILPIDIKADKIEAFLENGILTVILPKMKNTKNISIKIKEK